jgi:hypothetical protein
MVLLLVSRMDWFDMKDDNVGTSAALFEGLLVMTSNRRLISDVLNVMF